MSAGPGPEGGPRHGVGPEEEPPGLGEFLERSPARLLSEAALGGAAGVVLASVLPGGEGRELLFGVVGAVAATLSLMLTPVSGSASYRGLRYGLALAAVLTLFLSFAVGADRLPVEELLAYALLFFGIGALGHGFVAAALDRGATRSDRGDVDKRS
jgi:hypothetical protein